MPGPLAGIRILDCSEIIAAPYGASLLSDLGAEVIKIEPVEGEPWRLQNQFMPYESRAYMPLNRGKKGMAVNLRDPRGQEIFHKLVPTADVQIINYRPDTPAKLGIDYETVSKINPRLVYVWNTAFGRKGPHAHRPGYDIIIQAFSGIMAGWGSERGGFPVTMATAIADFTSAIVIAWAVTTGLYAREQTGKGQLVDTSLLGTAMALAPNRYFSIEDLDHERFETLKEGVRRAREEATSYTDLKQRVNQARIDAGDQVAAAGDTPGTIYYRTYKAADGYIAVGNLSAALREKFQQAMGFEDPRYGPDPDISPLTEKGREIGRQLAADLEARFEQKTVAEWTEYLDRAGVPNGPLKFAEELWDESQVHANGLIAEVEHPSLGTMKVVGPPIQFSDTPVAAVGAPPALGQDNDAILDSLGYSTDQIEELRAAGVIR